MPHQCTNCDRTFADGSKEMLSGCPDCGGNKFQFKPDGADSVDSSAEPPEPPEPAGPSSSVAQTVGKTAATVKDLVGGGASEEPAPAPEEPTQTPGETDSSPVGQAESPSARAPTREDTAQASARTDVVSFDELPSSQTEEDDEHHFQPVQTDEQSESAGIDHVSTKSSATQHRPEASSSAATNSEPEPEEEPRADRPGLEELRDELNDQFESIKVLEPGQYELNLMELYDREEYIVALQEDGRYSIQVPENFRD
jgi:predicted  nucleic acid-binding Zn-ribbon protein